MLQKLSLSSYGFLFSMRVWSIGKEPILLAEKSMNADNERCLFALYGHAGRIWDCYIDPKVVRLLVDVNPVCQLNSVNKLLIKLLITVLYISQ